MLRVDGELMTRLELKRNLWIRKLKVGDVVRAPSGLLRVVRKATHYNHVSCISFVIKHCSWTRQCYTVYTSHDLISVGYRPTGKSVSLQESIDIKIAEAIARSGKDHPPRLTCCDVEGIA